MDLVVKAADGYIRYFDFAVAEPSSVGYMGRGSLKDADGLRAADQRAAEKIRLFQKDITAVDLALFVPFVMDSSGRLGNCALEFLLRSKMPGRIIHRLKEQISINVARFGGKMIVNLKRGPPNG